MSVTYRIISIGALSRNLFWNETQNKRVSHATTTLICDGTTTILVDPGLPEKVLVHHLEERAGLSPAQIEVVFLTTFRPVHRRSLALFAGATWLMHEPEIEAMNLHLDEIADRADSDSDDVSRLVDQERSLLRRIGPAVEKLTKQVHLFPTPGVTPGAAGLLIALASRTIIVAGDAVVTQDHYEAGRIFERAVAVEKAQESFSDIIDIADEIVPGHDNAFPVIGR